VPYAEVSRAKTEVVDPQVLLGRQFAAAWLLPCERAGCGFDGWRVLRGGQGGGGG